MTPGQQAIIDGFNATLAEHGQTWTFGAASIAGVITTLRPTDPRMKGLPDRVILMQTITANLPSTPPTVGDSLLKAGVYYRIARHDPDESTGLTLYAFSQP
jgi:hypothetical protein